MGFGIASAGVLGGTHIILAEVWLHIKSAPGHPFVELLYWYGAGVDVSEECVLSTERSLGIIFLFETAAALGKGRSQSGEGAI